MNITMTMKMNIKILGRYIYGSGNSLDTDVLYLVDQMPGSIAECKEFCESMKVGNENLNIGVVRDGVLVECFKGTVDELNNAVYMTYGLHDQDSPLLIERMVERDVYLKLIRSVRSILSHFSRSSLRGVVKCALKGSWDDRLFALRDISGLCGDEIDLDGLNRKMSGRDVMKLVAFQIGQVRGLFDGVELYTKYDICERYGVLKKYLDRESDDWDGLRNELYGFYEFLTKSKSVKFLYSDLVEEGHVIFLDDGKKVEYDLKLEKRLDK